MVPTVSTTVKELPESRVHVDAEVPGPEVEKRVAQAARKLGARLKVPGFRAGKVPPPVIIQRLGRESVLDEAIRDSIGQWYSDAVGTAALVPVGEPQLNIDDLPAEGESLRFSFEIGVRPTARLGKYKGLDVVKEDVAVSDEELDQEIDRLRERMAKLETVDRAAVSGDFLLTDFEGTLDGTPFQGGQGTDQLIELGSGQLVDGFEDQLIGASAGESKQVEVRFPDDYRASELAGKDAKFEVAVKEVKEKQLPNLDDDFAIEVGFDNLQELRDDIADRVAKIRESEVNDKFRESLLDAVVDNADVEVPQAIVEARAREMWNDVAHSLAHRGISKDAYLRISEKTEDELVADGKPDAERALKREAVLAAVVEAEKVDPTDDELLEAIQRSTPAQSSQSPKKIFERLRSSKRLDSFKAEVAQRKALDLLVDEAKGSDQTGARDKLWTPKKKRKTSEEAPKKLWTPQGS